MRALAVLALLIAGNPVAYAKEAQLPKDKTERNRELGANALGVFNQFGLQGNYPEIRIVPNNHKLLGGRRLARAVHYESGPDSVYISKRALTARPDAVKEYLEHEASHIAAWRQHGPQISEHGKEWSAICKALASSPRVCKTSR